MLGTEKDLTEVFGSPASERDKFQFLRSISRARDEIKLQRLADVRAETVSWLWPGRVPWGKLTVIEGDPGLGKSTLTMSLAAHVTTGSLLPGAASESSPATVLLATFEDGIGDTVKTRLRAAGGDDSLVFVLGDVIRHSDRNRETPVSFPTDAELVRTTVDEVGAKLLIIDPLVAALGSETHSHRDADVRRALAPLSRLAEETGCAVVVVRHFAKGTRGQAVLAGGGSIGISGAARVVLQVHPSPDEDGGRVLAVAKNNLATMASSLQFRIVEAGGCGRIEWGGETDLSADDLIRLRDFGAGEDREHLLDAVQWLKEALKGGARSQPEILRDGAIAGHQKRTLQRAARRLGLTYDRPGFQKGTAWRLPETLTTETP